MAKIFKAITGAIGGLFKTPALPKAISMPDPGSTTAKLAAQKKLDAKRKGGREGTIYSQGGGAYQGINLGGTA